MIDVEEVLAFEPNASRYVWFLTLGEAEWRPLPGPECLAGKRAHRRRLRASPSDMPPAQQYPRGNHVVCEELLPRLEGVATTKGFVQVPAMHCLAPSRP
jgi:hypothetical protein